jgi:23S rRNA (pseudouridine1915-N3)-methyltransferase
MAWRLLTVGRPKDPAVGRMIDEYRKRLSSWAPLAWETVSEIGYRPGHESETVEREGKLLESRLVASDFVIPLDIDGSLVNSLQLSLRLSQYYDQGLPVVFVVGGSLGLSESVKTRAGWRWSLSPLTLPHALAALIAAEQIYRAFSIRNHHPYHKA